MVNSYVALGDSFTAGNGIEPGRRWPDLLAAGLAAGREDFEYLNLARDGADSRAVLTTIQPAIERQPDLVTLACGANDVLLSTRPDIPAFEGRFDYMLKQLREGIPGVRLLVSTYPDGWQMPGLGPRTAQRIDRGIRAVNQTIIELAFAHGVPCMDVTSHPGAREPGNLDADGLHPSELGHRRAAVEYAQAIDRHFELKRDQRRITA
jgi:acyl-CoA thioesterase-1